MFKKLIKIIKFIKIKQKNDIPICCQNCKYFNKTKYSCVKNIWLPKNKGTCKKRNNRCAFYSDILIAKISKYKGETEWD